MKTKTVPEIDVLIATGIWLFQNGWKIESVSFATGRGMRKDDVKSKFYAKFSEMNIPFEDIKISSNGPDIIATKDSITWKIECKGLGSGSTSTLRNNFDRALASTVSYFDQKNNLRVGLAIPREKTYVNNIKTRIPKTLREKLNLWIFLFNPDKNAIDCYEPNEVV